MNIRNLNVLANASQCVYKAFQLCKPYDRIDKYVLNFLATASLSVVRVLQPLQLVKEVLLL